MSKDNPGGSGWGALATTVGSGLFGFIGGKKRQERAFAHNKEAQERAYQQNLEQWEREKAYNDPSAQMARMKAAGLNPNLIYGSGSAATVAPSSPKKEAAKASYSMPKLGTADAIQAFQNTRLMGAQISSIEENTKGKELENVHTRQLLGIDESKEANVKYTKAYNEALSSTYDAQSKFERVKTDKLKVTEQQYANTVSKLKAQLAKQGIMHTDSQIARAIVLALNKYGYTLGDVTGSVIKNILYSGAR